MPTSGWSGPSAFSRMARLRLIERLGLGVAALGSVQVGQVVERGADVGVVGPQRLLTDREAALVERLGLGVAALGLVQLGQVVELKCRRRGGRAPAPSRVMVRSRW